MNENRPLKPRSTPASASAGSSSTADVPRRLEVLLGERQLRAGDVLGADPGMGRCPYAPMPSAWPCERKYRSASWCRRIGCRASASASAFTLPVNTYWCAIGTSGTVSPTISPSTGPHIPAHDTTMSAGNTSVLGPHPGDPVAGGLDGDDLLPELEPRPALDRPPRLDLGGLDGLRETVSRDQEPAEQLFPVQQRVQARDLVRVDQPALARPTTWPSRACASGRRAVRGWWRSPGRRPGRSSPAAVYFSTV